MSKAAKPGSPASDVQDLPFEEALKKLETIVESMESEELPLETMLARFEEGMRLSSVCQARLDAAELKIQQLERQPTGETTLKPLASAGGVGAEDE